MSAEVTMSIDKSWAQVLPRRLVSRGSGGHHRRNVIGVPPCKGVDMVQIVNRGDSFIVRLACTICGERCRMDKLWLAFPPGEVVRGEWVHRECTLGQVESAFGTKRVVLLNGLEALRRLVESLEVGDVSGPDVTAQRNGRRLATAKA